MSRREEWWRELVATVSDFHVAPTEAQLAAADRAYAAWRAAALDEALVPGAAVELTADVPTHRKGTRGRIGDARPRPGTVPVEVEGEEGLYIDVSVLSVRRVQDEGGCRTAAEVRAMLVGYDVPSAGTIEALCDRWTAVVLLAQLRDHAASRSVLEQPLALHLSDRPEGRARFQVRVGIPEGTPASSPTVKRFMEWWFDHRRDLSGVFSVTVGTGGDGV